MLHPLQPIYDKGHYKLLLIDTFVVRIVEIMIKMTGIEVVEMVSDGGESPIKISHREALGMLDQLLHVTGISEIDRNAFI